MFNNRLSKKQFFKEEFGKKSHKQKKMEKIGTKKSNSKTSLSSSVNVMLLRPIYPNLAVPLRDHITMYPSKVPLVPFITPLYEFNKNYSLPKFLLYKPENLTPVFNQGDCGSCWAFATCSVLADRLKLQTNILYDFSVQNLMACFERNGCDGGHPEMACIWLENTQNPLISSKTSKYVQERGGYVNTNCHKDKNFHKNKKENFAVVLQNSTYSVAEFIPEENYDKVILKNNIDNMKRALYETGPFYCALSVYDDLYEYDGLSIYKKGRNATLFGGHAIEIIGYCEKGVDKRMGFKESGYWICKNSWGLNWPLETALTGYFMVEMGRNMCGIESRCGFADCVIYNENEKTKDYIKENRFESFYDYMK